MVRRMTKETNMKTSLLFSFLSLAPLAAQAQDWRNIGPLRSGDATVFVDYKERLDYQSTLPGRPMNYEAFAAPVWINVQRAGLGPNDRVRVMIINRLTKGERGQRWDGGQEVYEAELAYAENGRFSGTFADLLLQRQHSDGYYSVFTLETRQELVFWINGVLYKDPSGANFSFRLRGL
jgi:hypothetical protein